jgi:uncharacterized membrane protein YkoI
MTFRFVPLLAFLFVLLPASAETVPLAEAPAAVRKTIQERLAKAKITGVDRDKDNGQVVFTIEFTTAGQSREMTLNEEGRILSAQVFLKDLPPALQIAIQRVATADGIERIEKVLDENPEYYSVDWKTKDGQAHAFDLWENGKLKSVQMTMAEVPEAVRKGIEKRAGSDEVKSVAKSFEEADVQYIATLVHSDSERALTVAESGEFLRQGIALAEAPPLVLKLITTTTVQGTLTSIDKVVDEGHWQYEVEWKSKDGSARAFTVLENGKLLNERLVLEETPAIVRAAIVKELNGDKPKEIAKSYDDGVAYNVTVNRSGRDRDFSIGEKGQLLRVEVSLAETPPPVQKGIVKFIGPGTIVSLDRTVEDDRTQYNINWKTTDGAAHSFSLLENGAMKSVSVALEEIPPPAKAVVVQEVGGAKLKEIARSFDDNAVAYDVTIIRDGLERDFTVTESGKLERRQLFATELAEAPQKTVQRVTNGGILLRIDQVFDPKNSSFRMEVESLIDGKRYDFSVGQNGLFFGENKP